MIFLSTILMTLGQSVQPVEPTETLQASAVQVASWFGKDVTKRDFKVLRYPRDTNYYVYGAGLTINLKPDGGLRWANDDQRREVRTKSASRGGVKLSETTIKSVALRLAKVAFPKSTFTVVDWYAQDDDFRPQVQQRSWESGCAKVRLLMDERRGQAYVLTITFETDTRDLASVFRGGPVATDRWRPKDSSKKGGR
jgi:hypothetical protein